MNNRFKETLTELRVRYWIMRGRCFVRRLLHRCVNCRKMEGKPYSPPPPPLPDFRVKRSPPFAHTGVDFAGLLYVKGTLDSTNSKVWICLYMCCVVRAVHLEVIADMSSQTFLQSFRQFIARRGFLCRMISDHAKTFKSASKIIRDVLTHPEVNQYFNGLLIEWSFNLERAPW